MCSRVHGSSILQRSTLSIPTTSFHANSTICDSRKSYLDTRKSTKLLPRPHLDALGALLGRSWGAREAPSGPQGGPNWAPRAPKASRRSPQGVPRDSRGVPGGPKGSPRGPQGVPKGSPRGPQGVPRDPQGTPRDPQGFPKGFQGVGGMPA